jgi:ATP-dependent protease ClpP protease subunit
MPPPERFLAGLFVAEFSGQASLMRSVILCASLVGWVGGQAHAGDPCAEGKLEYFGVVDHGGLYFKWTGEIANKMDSKLLAGFEVHKDKAKNLVLALDSCGGKVDDMERTIAALERIKQTHRVSTLVGRGATCGSACVFVFLVGEHRYGALTSSWLFHKSWRTEVGPTGSIEQKTSVIDRYLEKYFLPAGVPKKWLSRMRRLINGGNDYWQTGRDLLESKSGIITTPLENVVPPNEMRQRRYLVPPVMCGSFCRG